MPSRPKEIVDVINELEEKRDSQIRVLWWHCDTRDDYFRRSGYVEGLEDALSLIYRHFPEHADGAV